MKILFYLLIFSSCSSIMPLQGIKDAVDQVKLTTKKIKNKIQLKLSKKKPLEKVMIAYDQFAASMDKDLAKKYEIQHRDYETLANKIKENLQQLENSEWRDSENNNATIDPFVQKKLFNKFMSSIESEQFQVKVAENLLLTQLTEDEFRIKEADFLTDQLKDLEKKDRAAAHELRNEIGNMQEQKMKAQKEYLEVQEKRKNNLARLREILKKTEEYKERYISGK